MANAPGGQGDPVSDPQPNSENSGETLDQQRESTAHDRDVVIEPPIEENYDASSQPVIALRAGSKQGFRNRALVFISCLIVFFTVATLGTAIFASAYLSDDEGKSITTFASDLAKTAIPTLIALLGTAAAWAFKEDSEKD